MLFIFTLNTEYVGYHIFLAIYKFIILWVLLQQQKQKICPVRFYVWRSNF